MHDRGRVGGVGNRDEEGVDGGARMWASGMCGPAVVCLQNHNGNLLLLVYVDTEVVKI